MNIEFTRPVKIVTQVSQSTHPSYYVDEPYSILYRDEDTRITFNKTQGIAITLPTTASGDTHSVEFTIPNLEVQGSGSIEIFVEGDLQNNVDVNLVPISGEAEPIIINL